MFVILDNNYKKNTWKSVKWMRNRSSFGRLNQKYLSPTCTRGIPWTTACLSWISRAIFVMIACNLVPTANTICNQAKGTTHWLKQAFINPTNTSICTETHPTWLQSKPLIRIPTMHMPWKKRNRPVHSSVGPHMNVMCGQNIDPYLSIVFVLILSYDPAVE